MHTPLGAGRLQRTSTQAHARTASAVAGALTRCLHQPLREELSIELFHKGG